ncbi:MAG: hypothetical protein AABO57_02585 [Acidobacteriota bacterium]
MKDEEESFISRLSVFGLRALRDVGPVWLALALLTTIPYAAAALRTPNGYAFTGVLTAYDDTFTYFAWIRQGADGCLLMCDLFTSEPQSCEFFLPLWTILGAIARVTRMPVALTFHAARLLAGLVLLLVASALAASVMKSRTRVRYSLWLYAMSGGFGWLVYAVKNRSDLFGVHAASGSADLNMPEAIAFRSVFAQVHFAVGAALIFASIKLLSSALVEKKPSRALIAGILVSLLAVVHPYLVVVVWGVAGVALLTWPWWNDGPKRRRSYYNAAIGVAAAGFTAGTIPGVAYMVYLNRSNEVLREWLRITDTLSPPPWEYALGFGIVAMLAVPGFFLMWRTRAPHGRLLLIWALVQTAMLYAPLSFQRRLVEGLQLPLSIAASVALFWIVRKVFKRPAGAHYRKLFLVGAVTFGSLTNVGFVIGQMIARGPGPESIDSTDPRRYVPLDLIAAFDWLRANTDRDAVVFSSYFTGSLAPSMTGLHVFLGHYGQTIHSDEKGAQVTAFYGGTMNDEVARELFMEHRVRHVVYGPFEREISDSFAPPSWLKLAYRHGDVEIFEVTQELGSLAP